MWTCTLLPWLQMMGSVTRSKRALAEIFESGSNILVNMAGNRERLKVYLVSVVSAVLHCRVEHASCRCCPMDVA